MLLTLSALFLVLGWLTAEHFPPWVSWHNELWVFAGAVFWAIMGLASLRAQKIKTIVLPGVAWIGVLLVGVVWIQFALGYIVFFGDALVITFYVFICLLAMAVGRYAVLPGVEPASADFRNVKIEYLAATVLVGATCSAAIALAQVFQVSDGVIWISTPAYDRRPGGNLGQPNQLATLLLMGLASLLYLLEVERLRVASSIALFFLLMCGFAVAESRAGVLSFVLMVVWWMSRHRIARFRVTPHAVLLGGVAGLLLFWGWPPFFTFINAGGLPVEATASVNTSPSLRVVIWPQLVDAALQRPWAGWGLGELSKAHNAVVPAYALSEPYTYAHNFVLDLAVGMGLPLTIVLVAGTCVWLWRRVRATKTLLPWYGLAVVLPFGVHSLLEFPFAYAYFLVPAMCAVGALEGLLKQERGMRMPWWLAATALLAISASMAWSVREYLLIEEDFRIARFEAMQIGKTSSDYVRPRIYLLTQLDAMLVAARITPTPDMPESSIALLHDVAMHFPIPAAQNRYAVALALNGHPDEASKQLKVMHAMHFKSEYDSIREKWMELAETKYPQLKKVVLP